MSKPIVAIVGRPNVGKSMPFNKLIGQRLSIVEDTPGVTRDRIYGECEWCGRKFTLVDTGGIEPRTDSQILTFMREQAQIAIENATVIIFVTDIKTGLTASDQEVANMLLALAQADRAGGQQDGLRRRAESRITTSSTTSASATLCAVSAVHGHGTGDLLDACVALLPRRGRGGGGRAMCSRSPSSASRTSANPRLIEPHSRARSASSSPTSRARRATPSTPTLKTRPANMSSSTPPVSAQEVQGGREHREIQRAARRAWPSTARMSASS